MAEDNGMTVGTPEIASVGPIAFGPDDVLFVADNVRGDDHRDRRRRRRDRVRRDEAFDVDELDIQAGRVPRLQRRRRRDPRPRRPPAHAERVPVGHAWARRRRHPAHRQDRSERRVAVRGPDRRTWRSRRCPSPTRRRPTTSAPTSSCPTRPTVTRSRSAARKLRIARPPARASTVTDMAYVERRAPGRRACRTRSSRRTSVASRSRSRARCPTTAGDLPRLARQVGDRRAHPHLRALRRRSQHPRQLHVHAARALPAQRDGGGHACGRSNRRRAWRHEPAARHGLVPSGRLLSTC